MTTLLSVELYGEMPQSKLEQLRRLLKLERLGRLTDAEDAEFGYRYLRNEESNWVTLSLWRIDDTHWALDLSYLNEPVPAEVVDRCRREIFAAAQRLGLTAETG
jgi:hypothetical protein